MGERGQVDPGVVDRGPQRPLRLGRVGGPAVIVAYGDVADEWEKAFTQVAGRLPEGLLVTVETDHDVTDTEQPRGHGQPASVGTPGDDGRPCVRRVHSGRISASTR